MSRLRGAGWEGVVLGGGVGAMAVGVGAMGRRGLLASVGEW